MASPRLGIPLQDYELEVNKGNRYKPTTKLYRIHGRPQFSIGEDDVEISDWREWLMSYQ